MATPYKADSNCLQDMSIPFMAANSNLQTTLTLLKEGSSSQRLAMSILFKGVSSSLGV